MLLAAGDEDNHAGTHIYDATRDVARRMVTTPGRARFFVQTGHSIHNERPVALAREIVDFLTAAEAAGGDHHR